MPISCVLPILALSLSQRAVVVVPQSLGEPPRFGARVLARTASSDPIRLKYLVVPVRFATRDSTFSVEAISQAFSGDGSSVSVRRFYQEQSRGKVEMAFQFEPWMLSHVERDSLGDGVEASSVYYSRLAGEIDSCSRERGIDLSDFDNDGDGLLDGLIVVLAGNDQQETRDPRDPATAVTWYPEPVELASGVKFLNILHVAEISRGKAIYPGGVAHELAHLLGAADLYDDDEELQGRSGGVGSWDLMSSGNDGKWWVPPERDSLARRKPTGFSAFSRMLLGWDQPREIESRQEVRLKPGEAARLWTDSLRASEYLLLENRDRSGFDSILPGPGLLVMRVRNDRILRDGSGLYGGINADSSRMGVQVLEASGRQEMSINPWCPPSPLDLFGSEADTLTDDGPVPLRLPDGTRTGAWIREIRVDGDDVVFQASPAKRLGYGWESGSGSLRTAALGNARFTLVMPISVPAEGRIVSMTSVLPQTAGKICVGIWDELNLDSLGAPIASACDSGGFAGKQSTFRRFRHDLLAPIYVRSGQKLWIGQSIEAIGGNTRFGGMGFDPEIDTTWLFRPGSEVALTTVRPLVGVLVQTDSSYTASIPGSEPAPSVGIRRLGGRLRLDGALPGESIRFALRDPLGRILWSAEVACDAEGSAMVAIPAGGSGLWIAEAKGSFGTRTSLLPTP